jgi:nucleotide-binding universal stress UspA family protein
MADSQADSGGGDLMRILLGTDGSVSAGIAVDLVAGIDWPPGTAIRVAGAVETGPALFGGPWPAIALVQGEALEAEVRAAVRGTVEGARARVNRPGLEIAAAVLSGRPASAIVEAARTMDADLVVVGSRGHGRIESMLLGSVSSEVVDHAASPVLVARRPTISRLVLAWDGSDVGRVAADLVRTWPIFRHAAVHVVSVADVTIPWWTGFPAAGSPGLMPMYVESAEASRRMHAELARDMTRELGAAGLDATAVPREGDAPTQILAAATACDADLIVLGTHGHTGLSRLLLGSVARNVLHHATASVLVVRTAESRSSTSTGGVA